MDETRDRRLAAILARGLMRARQQAERTHLELDRTAIDATTTYSRPTAWRRSPAGDEPAADNEQGEQHVKRTVAAEVARLEKMSVNQLAKRFEEVFGEQCRSRHKRYLIRRIAWRLQANAEGGLSERAKQRAEELANDAEIRVTRPA